MNRELFEYLITIPEFDKFPELDRKFIHDIILGPGPTETISTGGTITSEGATPEVVIMEALTPVLMASRSHRLKPTVMREVPKLKKDK